MLAPEFEKLASVVKGNVKIAYWDTEQRGARPPLLGEIRGTPTIRLYKPKKKQGCNDTRKTVVDYNYERKAKDMKNFVDEQMPNFVERVNGERDFASVREKAGRNGLPLAVLFSSKAGTSPLTKYLSTEFRRRLLLAEVPPTNNNKVIMEEYGVKDLPALILLPPSEEGEREAELIRYHGESFAKHRLQTFLGEHALKKKVCPKPKKEAETKEQKVSPKKQVPKEEL